jgi:hypothetical protein
MDINEILQFADQLILNKTGKEHEEKFELLARLDLALKFKEMPT